MVQQNSVEDKDRASRVGLLEATKWGVGSFIPAAAASYYASKHSEFYRKKIPISAKIAAPLMLGLFFFGMMGERTAFRLANDRQSWGFSKAGQTAPVENGRFVAPIHHKVMNWLYDNPFKFILLTGAPLVGTILNQQLQVKHLKLQQRIMHSRIYGQAGVLVILLVTMGFRNYMDRHGRFPDESDAVEIDQEVVVPAAAGIQ